MSGNYDPNYPLDAQATHPANAEQKSRMSTVLDYIVMPEVNKATLSYYGSAKAVKKEKDRANAQKVWIIHPYSLFRRYWLVAMLLATFANVIVIPLGVSFFTEDAHYSPAWIVLNVLIDILFITDLALNFRIGYTCDESKSVILDVRQIQHRYLKTWFFPDLLAVTPVDYCLLISGAVVGILPSVTGLAGIRMVKLIKLIRLFSLLRLLRISRLLRYTRNWEEVLGWNSGGIATTFKFLRMIVIIILVCHWNACFQFMVATLMDFPEESWVHLDGLVGKPLNIQYTKSMFRSLCHMMTLNYGSVGIPRLIPELWVVITSMMIGTVMYALILAHLTAMVTNSRASEHVYQDKYTQLQEYMRHYRLPTSLRHRTIGHLENRYQGKWFDETAILMELSEPLRREIISYNCKSLISNMPVFKDADPIFINELLEILQFEMYQTGDLVIRRGEMGNCMYFIERGTVEMQTSNYTTKLSDGAFFGELCLVTSKDKRTADVKALTPCRLYCLSVEGYQEVLQRFPKLKAQIETVAQERLKNLPEYTAETELEPKCSEPHKGFRLDTKVHPVD